MPETDPVLWRRGNPGEETGRLQVADRAGKEPRPSDSPSQTLPNTPHPSAASASPSRPARTEQRGPFVPVLPPRPHHPPPPPPPSGLKKPLRPKLLLLPSRDMGEGWMGTLPSLRGYHSGSLTTAEARNLCYWVDISNFPITALAECFL